MGNNNRSKYGRRDDLRHGLGMTIGHRAMNWQKFQFVYVFTLLKVIAISIFIQHLVFYQQFKDEEQKHFSKTLFNMEFYIMSSV